MRPRRENKSSRPFDIVRAVYRSTSQARPRGFEKGDSGVHNQPGISGMISEKR